MSVTAQTLQQKLDAKSPSPALWWLNREAALNWLAVGLLLGAWNAVDDAHAARERPARLRGYDAVSVRALQGTSVER